MIKEHRHELIEQFLLEAWLPHRNGRSAHGLRPGHAIAPAGINVPWVSARRAHDKSALPPIAGELLRRSKMTQCATCGHSRGLPVNCEVGHRTRS